MTDFEKVLILHEHISDRINYGKFNNKTDAYTVPAPRKDCYISVEICSSTFTRKERIKYTDRVFISAGKKSAEFRIDINDKDSDLNYYIYYYSSNIADMGFSKSAYLTKSGMSSLSKDKLLFKVSDIRKTVILKAVK